MKYKVWFTDCSAVEFDDVVCVISTGTGFIKLMDEKGVSVIINKDSMVYMFRVDGDAEA